MKSKIKNLCFLFMAFMITGGLFAQNPIPAPDQHQKIAVVNATIHVGDGTVIEKGQLLFNAGKLEQVSRSRRAPASDYEVIDAEGKHVYPGLIALNTGLGLTEIGAVRSTRDGRETGSYNPNVRAMIAYNTDSQIIPTVRSRGVLLAQTTPTGGRVSGQSSVMQLDGWNYEDAVRAANEGVHINWPRQYSYNWRQGSYSENKEYEKQLDELKQFLQRAAAYCAEGREGETQLKLAAMCDLMNGQATTYLHVGDARSIQDAVLTVKKMGMKPVVVGGAESYMITDFLRRENVSVIIGSTQSLPYGSDEDIDQPFKTPAILAEAGVSFALSHGGYWEQRNLPFVAGTAVAYGLPYERAIQALTLDAAKIVGLDKDYGSLEAGKSATFIITSGDVLDMRASVVEHAFIDGRKIDLSNKQSYLDEKFREKYSRQ